MRTFLVFITLAIFVVPAFAETYTWVDDQGTVNFAEDLGKVPKKYRKKARIVGDEEPQPAEAEEGKSKPVVRQPSDSSSGEASQGRNESVPAAKQGIMAVYGGKDAATWKYEFAAARANLKAAEDQLVDNRNRLKDTSGMSRGEYLSIQNTIRSLEYSIQGQRKKLDALQKEAEAAGVPAELRE
jgi:hypothetical protein